MVTALDQQSALDAGEQEELLFVKDSRWRKRFLVDSGCQKSLLPPSDLDLSSRGSGPQMTAANGLFVFTDTGSFMWDCSDGPEAYGLSDA